MSADALQAALLASGANAVVEARERLAIITARDARSARAIAADRAGIVALASAHGFSHVALEIGAPLRSADRASRDAAVPGD